MSEFEQYTAQLKSPNENARANAAYKLGLLGDKEAISWLEQSLTDSSPNVRCQSAHALSRLVDSRVVDLLIAALDDPDVQVYGCVTSALSKIGNEQAITSLINEVHRQEGRRRSIATNKLIKIGKPAVADLMDAFNNSYGQTRAFFLKALGKIGDMRASEVFRKAILDEDFDVFWVAIAVQRTLRDPNAVPALITCLDHEDTRSQAGAARTLWSVGDERALEQLRKVAKNNRRDKLARSEALLALGKIGRTEAVKTLRAALKDNDRNIQWAALMGLSYTGDPKIVELLLDLANKHPGDTSYHNAIRNLGAIGDQSKFNELERILQKKNHYDIRVQVTAEETIEQLKQKLDDND